MAFRLAATIDGRIVRLPLRSGEQVLGSDPACPLHLRHPSVSRRHALLRPDAAAVHVEDLGSRNGTRAAGRRVASWRWTAGTTLRFGAVETVLEQLADEDLEPGIVLAGRRPDAGAAPVGDELSTVGSGPLEAFVLEHLPALLRRLRRPADTVAIAQAAGSALFHALPCTGVAVADRESGGTVFVAERQAGGAEGPGAVAADAGRLRVVVHFASSQQARALAALVDCGAAIVAAAEESAGPAPPREPAPEAPSAAAPPEPQSVVPRVREIYDDARRAAAGDVGVLILGESGTGKELLARFVHAASRAHRGPFVALNCAALPRDLLEAELFGIERGVATGVDARPGLFERADGGSLLLDEIGDMAPETQAKILRALQSGEVYRIGGREPRPVRVRTIAATNRDVHALIAAGTFREDLYHRLATWVALLPPLRERRADVPNLASHFLAREGARRGIRVTGISRAALDALTACRWPGNIRQLENEMARAALFLEDGELLDTARLSDDVAASRRPAGGVALAETLARVERDEIVLALEACRGDVGRAAARLGVSRATLYRRMQALAVAAAH